MGKLQDTPCTKRNAAFPGSSRNSRSLVLVVRRVEEDGGVQGAVQDGGGLGGLGGVEHLAHPLLDVLPPDEAHPVRAPRRVVGPLGAVPRV